MEVRSVTRFFSFVAVTAVLAGGCRTVEREDPGDWVRLAPVHWADGPFEVVDRQGYDYQRSVMHGRRMGEYQYFAVPDALTREGMVYVKVVHWEEDAGAVAVEYDSARPGAGLDSVYRRAEEQTSGECPEGGGDVVSVFRLETPGFAGRQNGGADLRVVRSGGSAPLMVRGMWLSRREPTLLKRAREADAAEIQGLVGDMPCTELEVPEPAPVFEYPIHADGGIVYDPLRREAVKTGALAKWEGVRRRSAVLRTGPYRVDLLVPETVSAYDVVPVDYRVSWEGESAPERFPLAVQAVAFEQESRRKGRDLHDLALPGTLDLDVEFLGTVTAHLQPGARHNLTPDMSDEPGQYPGFTYTPLRHSGVVEAGDLVWFRMRYTNTGNTILKSEGLGGYQLYPNLLRRNAEGEFVDGGGPYNLYYRDLEYLYPGESREVWIHCTGNVPGFSSSGASETPQGFGLAPGEYRFQFRITYRCYRDPAPFTNIWEGPFAYVWEMPFRVEPEFRQAPVEPGVEILTDADQPDKLTRFIHTFEEFMTAFDCWQSNPDGSEALSGTLYLQVAPWTEQVVVRLVTAEPVAVATVAVPLAVELDSLELRFDPDPPACLIQDGLRTPVIASQTMADMRANVQMGPYVEHHLRERLQEMMDHGINVVATTSMPWLYWDLGRPVSNYQGDAWKYALDVARDIGLRVEGWGTYPYDRATVEQNAAWVAGRAFRMTHYTQGGAYISHTDPLLPEANAAVWLYQFQRWGDLYAQYESGQVPISVEDTRGWMRQDVNVRYQMGERTVQAFQAWLQRKYITIIALNTAWGSGFTDFDQIRPEDDQVPNPFGHRWEYTNPENVFHDWSPAVIDLDAFRTELRVRNYRDTLRVVREPIPNAMVCLRTEGGNVLASGLDPRDPNPHFRHAYYSQRRCGAVAEILQAADVVGFHSDYTTVPYTPSELRQLVRTTVAQGIVPSYFPQFDNMRDIAINERYGTDYQVHYNLPEPKKGYMMHVLTALYPWFQATYEEGGIPGILWEDYQCDGFATETQKREMRLFRERLQQTISTPEALKARAEGVRTPSERWRRRATPMRSYRSSTVQ
jgi:hypothetical protein